MKWTGHNHWQIYELVCGRNDSVASVTDRVAVGLVMIMILIDGLLHVVYSFFLIFLSNL